MPFIAEIETWIRAYPSGSPERIILEFLRENAVGRSNAHPWSLIQAELKRHGYEWRLQDFQQGVLKASREGDLYIGSNDHGEFRGYFLIADREDAELMANWYQKRMETERKRLENLQALMDAEWP